VRRAYLGAEIGNEYSFLVAEYSQRKRLAGLGYFSPLEELPAWKSEAFALIESEINKHQERELKKKRGRK